MITLYNVISKDGYIARQDGSEDFIPDEVWGGFIDICRQNDTVIIGRKTYEAIQNYSEEMVREFEDLDVKRIVVTSNTKFIAKSAYIVSHSLKEAVSSGSKILISSGPILNTSALKNGLIDTVVLNVLPEEIGTGLKVFEIEPSLNLISEEDKENGRKWRTYEVIK